MKHKNFLWTAIFLLLIAGSFANAATFEITKYPTIPGYVTPNPNCTGSSCLPIFLSYWFGVGIYLAGAITLISLAIGGIRYLTSAGNPEAEGDARDRIKNSILGMVLVMAAFIIIRTINPVLITPTLTPLPGVQGVFYIKGAGKDAERRPVGLSVNNTQQEQAVQDGFTKIIYDCTGNGSGGTGKALYIWEFNNPGLEGGNGDLTSGVYVARKTCGQTEDIGATGSFKMTWEDPGVYYFLGDDCKGYMSGPNLTDAAQIDDTFKDRVKSIRVINDGGTAFGFIVHASADFEGECDIPYVIDPRVVDNNNCTPVEVSANSIDVFNFNSDVKASGNGVTFYSEPFGKDSRTPGNEAGFYPLSYKDIAQEMQKGIWESDPESIDFMPSYEFSGVSVAPGYPEYCPNFAKCPGSVKVEGNYVVALYTAYPDSKTHVFCEVFDQDVPNLNAEWFMGEGRELKWVDVIPIK